MHVFPPPSPGTWRFETARVALESGGCCSVPRVLCEAMRQTTGRAGDRRPPVSLLREIYQGTPARLIEPVIGAPMLSEVAAGDRPEWHRGDDVAARTGAPATFVAGYDILFGEGSGPGTLVIDVMPGSQRLPTLSAGLPTARVEFGHDDVVVMDSRLARRYASTSFTIVRFSVIRTWMTPATDFSDRCDPRTPSRLRAFLGAATRPAADVTEWLHRAHGRGEI